MDRIRIEDFRTLLLRKAVALGVLVMVVAACESLSPTESATVVKGVPEPTIPVQTIQPVQVDTVVEPIDGTEVVVEAVETVTPEENVITPKYITDEEYAVDGEYPGNVQNKVTVGRAAIEQAEIAEGTKIREIVDNGGVLFLIVSGGVDGRQEGNVVWVSTVSGHEGELMFMSPSDTEALTGFRPDSYGYDAEADRPVGYRSDGVVGARADAEGVWNRELVVNERTMQFLSGELEFDETTGEEMYFTDFYGNFVDIGYHNVVQAELSTHTELIGELAPVLLDHFQYGEQHYGVFGAEVGNGNHFAWIGTFGVTDTKRYPSLSSMIFKVMRIRNLHVNPQVDVGDADKMPILEAAESVLNEAMGKPAQVLIAELASNVDLPEKTVLNPEELELFFKLMKPGTTKPLLDYYQGGGTVPECVLVPGSKMDTELAEVVIGDDMMPWASQFLLNLP